MRPPRARAPTWRKERRDRPSQKRARGPRTVSIRRDSVAERIRREGGGEANPVYRLAAGCRKTRPCEVVHSQGCQGRQILHTWDWHPCPLLDIEQALRRHFCLVNCPEPWRGVFGSSPSCEPSRRDPRRGSRPRPACYRGCRWHTTCRPRSRRARVSHRPSPPSEAA